MGGRDHELRARDEARTVAAKLPVDPDDRRVRRIGRSGDSAEEGCVNNGST